MGNMGKKGQMSVCQKCSADHYYVNGPSDSGKFNAAAVIL